MRVGVELPVASGLRVSALARGQLVGWAAVAAVDGAALSLAERASATPALRLAHQAYDAGVAIAAGVVSLVAVELWTRFGVRRRRAGLVALAVASIVASALVARDDVSGVASSLPVPRALALTSLVIAVATVVPLAAAGSRAALRRTGRLAPAPAVMAGISLAAASHAFGHDYEGLRAFASWTAAVIVACAFERLAADRDEAPASAAWLVAAAILGAGALAIEPSNALALDVLHANGGRLGPWILRARRAVRGRPRPVAPAWLADRSRAEPVPPSSPPLLPEGAIVVLLTVDALRADLVAPENAQRLPALAALARESVVFATARSTAPGTMASLASLFAGKVFSELYWTPLGGLVSPHADVSPRFPEVLAATGVATVTFAVITGMMNRTGIARGFDEETYLPGDPWATAPTVMARILARVRRHGRGPLFVYAHLTDPHAPYASPQKDDTDFERYLAAVAVVDAEIARLREALAAPELAPRAALIVSADHGEAFGEHGTRFHSTTLYDELLRVPLLVSVPGVAPRVVPEPVSLLDVGPTILDLMGSATPATFMGQSLVPYLRGQSARLTRPIVAESSRAQLAMVSGDLKVIKDLRAGTCEAYDLAADPGELHNLADDRRDPCADLAALHAARELRRPGYATPFIR